jgi:hypothetical protein
MDVGGRALPGANAEEARSNTIAPTNFFKTVSKEGAAKRCFSILI